MRERERERELSWMENSTTNKEKELADPLPLLPFTYAFCMVVSSMVLMIMMDGDRWLW